MPASPGPNLNLWKKQLGHVPDSVWQQTQIETLILADNNLIELSGQIGRLKMLRMLDLGHNQLTYLPDEIGDLPNLTDFLYLHDNRLTSLPPSFASLTRLRYLNISENAFEAFPECISRMSSLLELRMTDNRLQSLPASIGQLSRLRELHLRNNSLTSLPSAIGEMQELRQIDLRGNPLTELPPTIAIAPSIGKIGLEMGHNSGAARLDSGSRSQGMFRLRLRPSHLLFNPPRSTLTNPTQPLPRYKTAKLKFSRTNR